MAEKTGVHDKAQESKQRCSNFCKRKSDYNYSGSPADRVLQLQETAGNQAVQKLVKSRALQAKLKIGQLGDIYEQEADRVAEQVMRMPEPQVSKETKVSSHIQNNSIQRRCPSCIKEPQQRKEEEKEPLQKKEASDSTPEPIPELDSYISDIRDEGQPLPESVRTFYEPRFDADFSGVRVHIGSYATETAKSINARAFTVGNNIAFGGGQFAPESHEGRKLLAHELTHTIQQGATNISPSASMSHCSAVQRQEPKKAGEKIGSDLISAPGSVIQRQPNAPETVDIRDLPFADKEREQIRKSARDSLPVWADIFANLWYDANNGALGAIAEPEDPDFKSDAGHMAIFAFGTSLAGNMVWAATCLVSPESVAIIRAMSFGGAIVGSGTIGVMAGQPTSSQPSFKTPVASALARARDSIAGVAKNQVKDVADNCAVENVTDTEEQKKKLWAKMFNTTYNQAEPIVSAATSNLTTAATSFVAQWQIHKKSPEVAKEAWRRTDERIKRDGYPWHVRLRVLWEPSPSSAADEYRLGVFNEENLKYAAESFKPIFKF